MRVRSSSALVAVLGFALQGGCDVGDLGTGGDPNDPDDPNDPGTDDPGSDPEGSGDYTLTATPATQDLTLGTSAEIAIDVTANADFSGAVALSALGAPTSWSTQLTPAEVSLAPGETARVTLTIIAPTDAEATTANISIEGASAAGSRAATAAVTVDNVYVIALDNPTGQSPHGFPGSVTLSLGAVVKFVNYDTTSTHRIHAGNELSGFPHEDTPMAVAPAPGMPGGSYEVTIIDAGVYSYYCHIHDAAGVGFVVMQ